MSQPPEADNSRPGCTKLNKSSTSTGSTLTTSTNLPTLTPNSTDLSLSSSSNLDNRNESATAFQTALITDIPNPPLLPTDLDNSIKLADTIQTTLSLTTTTNTPCPSSIQDWITQISSPSPSSTSQQSSHNTPTHRCLKRRRSSISPPSASSAHALSSRKKRRPLQEMDNPGEIFGGEGPRTPVSKLGSSSSGRDASDVNRCNMKPRPNAFNIGQEMAEHGMAFKSQAFDDFPEFAEKVRSIVGAPRSCEMDPASARKIQQHLDFYGRTNEATLMHMVFPLLIKNGYNLVKDRADFSEEEKKVLKENGSIYRDFFTNERIVTILDCEFERTYVPSKYSDPVFEHKLAKVLRKNASQALSNPKPDFTFGLEQTKIPRSNNNPLPLQIRTLLGIAQFMFDPYLIVEAKSTDGDLADAQNQARRGGATLVHANRLLRNTIGILQEEDEKGPDYESFVFSITMSPDVLEVWVHWYQGPASVQIYHMNKIETISLSGYDSLNSIRQALHNIQQWSVEDRLEGRRPLFDAIDRYALRVHEEALSSAQDIPAKNRSPRKRPRVAESQLDTE